jgi:hypothetical protein
MTKPLYFYNGTTFELVGPTTPQSPIAYQTSAPTAPATGDLWIDSDGDVDTYNRQLTRYYFVATAGQTTISGVDANSLTLAYVAGSEAVYVNGALQVRGQDYTATNGTSVVMSSGLAVNDVVEIFAYTAFIIGDTIPKSTIQAKGDLLAGTANTTVGRLAVGSNGQHLIADSTTATGLKYAPVVAFRADRSGTQSLTGYTYIKVQLNNEIFDTNNNFDPTTNYRFTPTVAGYYQISAGVAWVTSNTGNQILIYKNGSRSFIGQNQDSGGLWQVASGLVYCNGSTDYIELYAAHLVGSNKDLTTDSFMTGILVREA